MPHPSFPFAVRLIGFTEKEAVTFDATFAVEQGKGYGYFRLAEDNLQDPDIYIANADDANALTTLAALHPSDVRPALLIGNPAVDTPYRRVERPLRWDRLFEMLDELVEKRADALSRLEASDIVIVPERRRRPRLANDTTDPAEYIRMRATLPDKGSVLVVDKNPAFRDMLAGLLTRDKIPVAWASDETRAVALCRQQQIAVVLINTTTPAIDPYRLCWGIKEKDAPAKITVIFLVGKSADYDVQQARYVGVEGYLTKPVASHHLLSTLKKFMPFLR